jgi:hypothetical protein
VAWSLLTASGATVLVSHEAGPPLVRLSFASARLEAGPGGARWSGGAELALPPPVCWAPDGRRAGPGRRGHRPGRCHGRPGRARAGLAVAADLGDLLVVARVLEALRVSARSEQLVPVA